MNRKAILIILGTLAVAVVAIVVADILRSRPEKRSANPFEYSVDDYRHVDPSLVKYEETLNFTFGDPKLKGIAFANDRLYVVEDNFLLVVTPDGEKLAKAALPESPECVAASPDFIYIGYRNRISLHDLRGEHLRDLDSPGDSTVFTCLAVEDSLLFAADAGKRQVIRYTASGKYLGAFEGKRDSADLHGFILPSPYFDLAVNRFGELWVANTGRHAFENYTFDGRLIGYWERTSIGADGFSGCCNPAHFSVMPDGSFVTAEKGMVRIKIHKATGDLDCFVAPPSSFGDGTHAPDLAVSPDGDIYALDYDRNMVRCFKLKKSP